MKKPRRYAEGTEVSVLRSQQQIKELVASHGADAWLLAESEDEGLVAVLQFRLQGRMLRYRRHYPRADELTATRRARTATQTMAALEAEWRRRWRALFLILKAKLEVIAAGESTLDHEFMADILLPEGGTVGDVMLPQLKRAYDTGEMPRLLPGGGDA